MKMINLEEEMEGEKRLINKLENGYRCKEKSF